MPENSLIESVVFFLTYRCNLRCTHCWNFNYMPAYVKQGVELSKEQIVNTIKDSELLRGLNICFTGGEIFVRKDIEYILLDISSIGVNFNFNTNGCFPEKLNNVLSNKEVRSAIRGINLSIDGTEDIHDVIRGKGSFEKLMESIKIIKSYGMQWSAATIIQNKNIDFLSDINQLIKDLGPVTHAYELEMCGISYLKLDKISVIKPYISSEHYQRILNEVKFPGVGCRAGKVKCNIRADGVVEACASSSQLEKHFILGDLKDYGLSFDNLWNSERAEKVRGQIESCSGCASFCER